MCACTLFEIHQEIPSTDRTLHLTVFSYALHGLNTPTERMKGREKEWKIKSSIFQFGYLYMHICNWTSLSNCQSSIVTRLNGINSIKQSFEPKCEPKN